jgi:hypothetical protein
VSVNQGWRNRISLQNPSIGVDSWLSIQEQSAIPSRRQFRIELGILFEAQVVPATSVEVEIAFVRRSRHCVTMAVPISQAQDVLGETPVQRIPHWLGCPLERATTDAARDSIEGHSSREHSRRVCRDDSLGEHA